MAISSHRRVCVVVGGLKDKVYGVIVLAGGSVPVSVVGSGSLVRGYRGENASSLWAQAKAPGRIYLESVFCLGRNVGSDELSSGAVARHH